MFGAGRRNPPTPSFPLEPGKRVWVFLSEGRYRVEDTYEDSDSEHTGTDD